MNQFSSEILAGASNTVELSTSDQHRLLASEQRRLTLDILDENNSLIELEELATGIVARENEIDTVSEDAIDHMTIKLHHVHLPLMDEMGVLDYEPDEHLVRFS